MNVVRGKVKTGAVKDSWYKRNPRDFYEATRNLTLEQRGAYSDIIDLLYMRGGSLPDDPKWMSHALHISPRKWKPIRTALLDAGKIQLNDGQIVNSRVTSELDSRSVQSRVNSESALNRERTKRENLKNANENNETLPQKQHHIRKKKEEEKKETQQQPLNPEAAREAAAKCADAPSEKSDHDASQIDYADLNAKLIQAGGSVMRLNCAGIHDTSPIVGCLRSGADLMLDVLPTVERLAKTKPPGSVSSWAFFVDAIAKAKQARLSAETTVAKKPPKKLSFMEMSEKQTAWWAEQRRLIAEDEAARHAKH